jgi:hypothetical protein
VGSAAAWDRAEARLSEVPLGRFVTPRYEGRALPNVAASLWRAVVTDGPGGTTAPPAHPLSSDVDPLAGRRPEGPIVLVLIDGLGWPAYRRALGASSGPASFLPSAWSHAARPITTVFPSTTTAALTSLSTGSAPSQHGIVGHRQYLPRFGAVADMLRMAPIGTDGYDSLVGPQWDRGVLTPVPTLFERGMPATVITRDRFQGSGFTRLLYAGAEFRGYATASELALELADVLGRPRPPPAVLVYWDELDLVHHLRGPEPYLFEVELGRFQAVLAAAAGRLDPGRRSTTQVWVTGDHGLVRTTPEANVRLDQQPKLLAELTHAPAGDRRAGFLATRPGRAPVVEAALRELLPDGTEYLPMSRAIEDGLFGPPPYHPELDLRTGTLLVLPPAPAGMTYQPPGHPAPRRHLHGAHGGAEREEMWVPLVAATLAELTEPAGPAKS